MPNVCIYLQLHQPYRLSNYSVFDVGNTDAYFADDSAGNREIFTKVATKSYIPMLQLLHVLLERHSDFKCALSCSGVFLDQAEEYVPEVISLLKAVVKTGRVELLSETYYHSLAALYSPAEFKRQVAAHTERVQGLFGVTPVTFRNTELIYSNDIARQVVELGYEGMLTEAVPYYLGYRDKTQVFVDLSRQLPLLLKHAELSDDVAFRFSDRNWAAYPLSADQYLAWFSQYPADHCVNLFMDFETFGEHQWADTGVFDFFASFVEQFLRGEQNRFVVPREMWRLVRAKEVAIQQEQQLQSELAVPKTSGVSIFARMKALALGTWQMVTQQSTPDKKPARYEALPIYDVPYPISWADVNRDLTAWIDNPMQQDTLHKMYALEEVLLARADTQLLNTWRRLQTSDHFYYMCTKWSADGDVHAYFSPYDSPYEAYRRFCIVLADLEGRVG